MVYQIVDNSNKNQKNGMSLNSTTLCSAPLCPQVNLELKCGTFVDYWDPYPEFGSSTHKILSVQLNVDPNWIFLPIPVALRSHYK